MSKQLSFQAVRTVQFFHPGGEYKQSADSGAMPWNEGPHHRKFLCADGDYVSKDERVVKSRLCFWGEWEPTSEFKKTGSSQPPYYIHRPFVHDNEKAVGNRQNTDPFVFSDAFIYHCCQQTRKTGPSQLYRLAKGSVILFGSHVGNQFALDTVFVVDESREYSTRNVISDLKDFVSPRDIEVAGIGHASYSGGCGGSCTPHTTPEGKPVHFRCYKGATFENPVDGMYSFVPCRLSSSRNATFERLMLTKDQIHFISNEQKQGFKSEQVVGTDQAKEVWKAVRDLCREKGFNEGLRFYYDKK